MNASVKRQLSFFALIAGAVIFGVVLASSTNWTPESAAQKIPKGSPARAVAASPAIPSFADMAAGALPSVVSITSTDIVKGPRRHGGPQGGDGQDPFEFFFRFPQQPGGPGQRQEPQEHKEESGGSGFIISEDGYILTTN